MKQLDLNAINSLKPHQTQRADSVRAGNPSEPKSTPMEPSKDSIELSSQSLSVAQLVDQAKSLPDVRSERVEALRQLVESGNYDVSSQQIAEAILRDEL